MARGKIRTFKGENAYGVARLVEIPSEINVEVEQKRRRKKAIAVHCEDNVELETEGFDSSDSNWSFVTSDEEELEVEEAVRRKSTRVQYDETTEIPHFALNMVFDGPKQFKEAINKYASTRRVNIDLIKNDKVRVRAKCKAKNCDWLIYAARDNKTGLFLVKNFRDEHTCSWSFQVRRFTSTYMAKHYLSLWRAAPSMKLQEFKRIVREQMSLDVTISQCRRTKEKVIARLNGTYSYEFSRLWNYCEEILHRNPRNTVKVKFLRESPNSRPIFQRIYVCFDAVRNGFLKGCRPLIGLDGCFLKGMLKGELLTAVGRDANNQMYPIAWAIVEVENKDSWGWFVEALKYDLGTNDGVGYTVISDQQKGLVQVLEEEMSLAEHRRCARHIYANWRKKNGGNNCRKQFWMCAKSTTIPQFEKHLEELGKMSKTGKADLMRIAPKYWCKAFFETICKSDIVDNNLSEAFNGSILEARHMSIISMLEDIREKIITRMHEKRGACQRWKRDIAPRILEKIEGNKKESAFCHVLWNGEDGFEVRHKNDKFVVDIRNNSCSCRAWDLSGIPCPHAICVILFKGEEIETFVAHWYKKDRYLKTYSHYLEAMNGDNLWPSSDKEPLVAPMPRVMPGRPKRKRIREEGESRNGFKDEEILGQREANSLVTKMHHNNATTREPELEGSQSIPILRNTDHDVVNVKKVESTSHKFITITGLERQKANIMKVQQQKANIMKKKQEERKQAE
ncbi:uncharacterized protein LOC120287001 [Eucalyptus grandis]|uniref:uncharacterized protein LOC120287001 n=1 Tax=Eucalyptus grandis TaxID=71139 RepID=UPI00192F0F80|nr:uncharacterized protein LOC120287001 [Eucalyptus grandis]